MSSLFFCPPCPSRPLTESPYIGLRGDVFEVYLTRLLRCVACGYREETLIEPEEWQRMRLEPDAGRAALRVVKDKSLAGRF